MNKEHQLSRRLKQKKKEKKRENNEHLNNAIRWIADYSYNGDIIFFSFGKKKLLVMEQIETLL